VFFVCIQTYTVNPKDIKVRLNRSPRYSNYLMKRNIAFYICRRSLIKVLAPVINHMVTHCLDSFQVIIFFPGWKISKPSQQPNENEFNHLFGEYADIKKVEDGPDFVQKIESSAIDAVITLAPSVVELEDEGRKIIAETRKLGTKWIALPHIGDEVFIALENIEFVMDDWDLICIMGPYWLNYIETYPHGLSKERLDLLKKRLVITGYPELDGFKFINQSEVINKYGLPKDKPIIFLATAPLMSTGLMSRGLLHRFCPRTYRKPRILAINIIMAMVSVFHYPIYVPYIRYLKKLREFADRNNAFIVAKTREKHNDPDSVENYVDKIISDSSFYPFTTLELLSVSSLYFGFSSASIFEAIAAGVYSINVVNRPQKTFPKTGTNYKYLGDRSFVWNTQGVSEGINGTKISAYFKLDRFSKSNLDDYVVNKEQRASLLSQFFSYFGKSSERFIEVLSSLW